MKFWQLCLSPEELYAVLFEFRYKKCDFRGVVEPEIAPLKCVRMHHRAPQISKFSWGENPPRPEIRAIFPACQYLDMTLGKWPNFQKLHIYPLSTPRGRNWAYFCSMGSGFRDTSQFSKLPYLGMKLGSWPKFQKLHMYPPSTQRGRNWAYFRSTGSGFRDISRFPKFPYLGMKHGLWPRFQKLHTYSLSSGWCHIYRWAIILHMSSTKHQHCFSSVKF